MRILKVKPENLLLITFFVNLKLYVNKYDEDRPINIVEKRSKSMVIIMIMRNYETNYFWIRF